MRTHNHKGVVVTYPDEHCYIFNPVVVSVAGIDHGTKVTITVGDTSVSAYSWQGVAVLNIGPILQSFFAVKELSLLPISDTVSLSKTARTATISIPVVELTFTTLCVWGALQTDMGVLLSADFNSDYSSDFLTGTLGGGNQLVGWFGNLPLSISVPMLAGNTIAMGGTMLYTAPDHQIVNLSLNALTKQHPVVDGTRIELLNGSTVKRAYTISRQEEPKSPIYLRWIDKKGYYNYWAFEKGADEFESEKFGTFITTFSRDTDYIDGFNGGDGRQQGKTSKRSITLAAPLVDMSTWNYLLGITQAPIVDLYTDNDYLGKPRYIKVDVTPGKTVREARDLADFVATVSLPDINNQRL